MKKIVIVLALLMPLILVAEETEKQQTKFERFVSKTGVMIKFVDTKMPNISGAFGYKSPKACIRTVLGETENTYFYVLSKESDGFVYYANIEYSDLVEINKAIKKMIQEVTADCDAKPYHLENRFITEEGFRVGYVVEKSTASWYIRLNELSASEVFLSDFEELKKFHDAQAKIEELKAQNGK